MAVPIWKHGFEGHEREYLSAFEGGDWQASTRVYPLLAQFYEAIGVLFSHPLILVAINLVAALATLATAWVWIQRRWSEEAAWMATILLALSPVHAFWSTSIYNVTLPHAALVMGLALGGWRGALCFGLACNLRIELALLAPAVWLLSDWRVALGALGAATAWPLLESAPNVVSPWEAFPVNVFLPDMMGPLGSPFGLLLLVLAIQKHNRLLALCVLLFTWWAPHLMTTETDTLSLIVAASALLATTTGWRRLLPIAALALLVLELLRMPQLVRMTPEDFAKRLPDLPTVASMPPCHEILDDPLAEGSHWRQRSRWPIQEVCWGEERIHHAWTTRGLQDRRLRMHRTYGLEPWVVLQLPSGPRLIYKVEP